MPTFPGVDEQDALVLDLDAFIRSVGINKATQHALLLGAGAFGPSIRGKLHLGMEASHEE
jgi:hypothetical protein